MLLHNKMSANETVHADAAPLPVHVDPAAARRRIDSLRLLEGARELVIEHHGSEYHLRLTRNDKLILTK